jgi:hypothetical protein
MAVLRTRHMWHDSTGGECHAEVYVTYTFHRGYADTWEEPGQPDHVEVDHVEAVYADDRLPDDIELEAFADECLQDWREAEWHGQ